MNKKTEKEKDILNETANYFNKYLKKINNNPFIIIHSWSFRFFFGAVFYIVFPGGFINLLLISIIFEIARYFFVIIKNPLYEEKIIDRVLLIFLSLMGFLLMEVIL